MALSDYKLKFAIDGETRDFDQAMDHVYGRLNNIGGSATAAFGGFIPVARMAATAIAGVGLAAGAASLAIFNLVKATSDFGSEIYDATQKTGQSAELMSALKYAAEQSGSSLDTVTKGIAKFAKEFKGTSGDLQTELGFVIKKIAEAKPGFEQLQLAQQAFGKSGAELIPVIRSFNGNLPELIERLTKMGLIMDDEAAAAADNFGDTLGDLQKQAGALGREFAVELMPQMTSAMAGISRYMAANRGEASAWAQALIDSANGVGVVYRALEFQVKLSLGVIDAAFGTTASKTVSASAVIREAILNMIPPLMFLRQLQQQFGSVSDTVSSGVNSTVDMVTKQMGVMPTYNGTAATTTATGRAPGGNVKDDAERRAREEEERRRKAFGAESDRLQREFDRSEKFRELTLKNLERDLAKGLASEEAYAEQSIFIARRSSEEKIKFLEELLAAAQQFGQETLDIQNRLEMAKDDESIRKLNVEIDAWKDFTKAKVDHEKAAEKLGETVRRFHEEERERNREQNEWLDTLRKKREEEAEEEEKRRVRAIVDRNNNQVTRGTGMLGGVSRGMGIELPSLYNDKDELLNQADFVKAVYADVSDFAGAAIGQMVEGLAQLGVQWLMTGEFSAQAALKMLAGAALSIATQSVFKGIFELAEAAAAAARYDFASAALHKAASSIYFKTAAIAGAVGVGAALVGRAVGGGAGAGSGGSGGGSGGGTGMVYGSGRNYDNQQPYQRASEAAYYSGTRDPHTARLAAAVERLDRKLASMSPGDVLTAGARQRRGFIGNEAVSDIRSSRVRGTDVAKAMGMR